jgi:DNA-binding CsgD family transcriptional regulator
MSERTQIKCEGLSGKVMSNTTDPFVGREQELSTLLQRWSEAESGGGHIDLVTGEPGVGKSRLIREYVRHSGANVYIGQCIEGFGAPPYWPWVRIMAEIAKEVDLAAFESQATCQTQYLAYFDAGVFGRFASGTHAAELQDGPPESASQYYMFQSLCELVAYASAQAPIAIVIEDLHWGDDGTCAFFRFLASEMPNLRLHLIATHRNTDIGREAPFASVVGHLHSSPYVTTIRLWGITGDDINALLTELRVRGDIGALADEISNRTGGNTLFVRALIAELGDSPLPQSIAALPEGIRHLVGLSTARLSKEEYEIVCHAAVLGSDNQIRALAQVIDGLSYSQVVQGIDSAIQLNILEPIEAGDGSYRFHHDVIRQSILSEMSLASRIKAHARCAIALEALNDGKMRISPEELFRHYSNSEGITDPAKTAAYALAAGHSAMSRHDFLAASKYYTKGLESADGEQSELYARLCFAMATALRWRLVRPHETEDLIRIGADILIRLENTDLLIESMRKLRMYSVRPALIPVLNRIIPLIGKDEALNLELRAVLYCIQKANDMPVDEETALCVKEGLERIHLDDEYLSIKLHSQLAHLCSLTGRYHAQLAFARRIKNIIKDPDDPRIIYITVTNEAGALMRLGRNEEASKLVYSVEDACLSQPENFFTRHATAGLFGFYLLDVDWDALERLEALLKFSKRKMAFTDYPWVRARYLVQRDRIEEAAKIYTSVPLESLGGYMNYLTEYPGFALITGVTVYDEKVRLALRSQYAQSVLHAEASAPIARAYLAMVSDDREGLLEILPAIKQPENNDLAWMMLGIFHAYLGDFSRAIELFNSGMARGKGNKLQVAWLNFFLGTTCCDAEPEAARHALESARSQADQYGLLLLARRIDELDGSERPRGGKEAAVEYGLTKREIEVLREVADGKTDAEIAESLFISPKTASNHVSNILRKTGTGNRTEAVHIASTKGLVNSG